jgi:hypothetical protein
MEDRTATKVEFRARTDGPVLGSMTLDRESSYWIVRVGDASSLTGNAADGVQQLLTELVTDRAVPEVTQ